MGTRLLREGPDVQALVAQVREEFGPEARVVRAERVRTGGIAGFFAKESYELTIDVPDPVRAPARRPAGPSGPAGPTTIEGMLDAADAADLGLAGAPSGAGGGAPSAVLPFVPAPFVPARGGDPAAGPGDEPGTARFDQVLAQVQALADDAHAAPAPAPFTPLAVPSVASATSVPSAPSVPSVPAVPTQHHPAEGTPTAASTAPGPATTAPAAPAAPADGGGGLRRDLLGLGVPEELLGAGEPTLASVVSRIPAAPAAPRAPGAVHVVVGAPADVLSVAHVLLERLGAGPGALVRAGRTGSGGASRPGGRVLGATSSVSAWRGGAGDAPHAWVVALGVRDDATGRTETARMLRALRPDSTWVVVDARLKPRDAQRWMHEVSQGDPGLFDAVAARGVFETADPGTVLGLGLPVALIDGVPCSPVAWAAALGQALGGGWA